VVEGDRRVKLVGRPVLSDFVSRHADARDWVQAWIADVETSNWATPHTIKGRYPSVSFLADNVAIFNVKGNKYRLETKISYSVSLVLVRWAGTHAEYTKRQ
jgi:mRNA interferase HigB